MPTIWVGDCSQGRLKMRTAKAVNFGTISSVVAFQIGGRGLWLRAMDTACICISSNTKVGELKGCSQICA